MRRTTSTTRGTILKLSALLAALAATAGAIAQPLLATSRSGPPAVTPFEPPRGDYGDAPDGTSARYAPPFAHVMGRFPTNFATTNSRYHQPGGHTLNAAQEHLGSVFSLERGPRDPADPDKVENFVDDDFDDGWVTGPCAEPGLAAPWGAFIPTTLSFRVTVAAGAPAGPRYINVLYDVDHDGAWSNGPGKTEWLVVDAPVGVAPGSSVVVTVGPFPFPVNANGAWTRVALTRTPIVGSFADDGSGWDGSGVFQYGEIEDFQLANALSYAADAASSAASASASVSAFAGLSLNLHVTAFAAARAQAEAHAVALAAALAIAEADADAAAQAHAVAVAAAAAVASACISCPCAVLCAEAGAAAIAAVAAAAEAEASASAAAAALAIAYAQASAQASAFALAQVDLDAHVSAFAAASASATASASSAASAAALAASAACGGDAQAAALAAADARASASAAASASALVRVSYYIAVGIRTQADSQASWSASAVSLSASAAIASSKAKAAAEAAALAASGAYAAVFGACSTCYVTCPPCPTTTPSDRYSNGRTTTPSMRTTTGASTWTMTGVSVGTATMTSTGIRWQAADIGTFIGMADVAVWDAGLVQSGAANDFNPMISMPGLPATRTPVLNDCGQPVQMAGRPVFNYAVDFPQLDLPFGAQVYIGVRPVGGPTFNSGVLSAHRDHSAPFMPSFSINGEGANAVPADPCGNDHVMYTVSNGPSN